MQLSIKHVTQYDYDHPVDYALQKVRLTPLNNSMQSVATWDLDIEGGKVETQYRDHFGNHVDLVSATPGTQNVTITAHGIVDTYDKAGIFGKTYGRAPLWLFQQPTPMTATSADSARLSKIVEGNSDLVVGLHDMSAAILQAVPYEVGHTTAASSAEDALSIGRGVCQDHANIFVAAARGAGLPARYVSGYLLMPDRVDQDASHAWAEVHVPDLGWVGFDVSNGVSPDEKYVRIAIGRDALDAAPMAGMRVGASTESMIVHLQVQQ